MDIKYFSLSSNSLFSHSTIAILSRSSEINMSFWATWARRDSTSSIIPLTFLCWQNTMSFKCLILSRRSTASSCSCLDFLAAAASVLSVSSNNLSRCSHSCSFCWSWSFSIPMQLRRRSTSMIRWSLSAIFASAVLRFLSASSRRLMYSSSWACRF